MFRITRKVLGKKIAYLTTIKKINSPGLLRKHYSPGIPIKLNSKKPDYKAAFIVFGKQYKKRKDMFNLSKKSNLNEAAKNLYKVLISIKHFFNLLIYPIDISNVSFIPFSITFIL